MADTVKNDSVQNEELNSDKNEAKEKKDKENEKIKTENKEEAKGSGVDSSTVRIDEAGETTKTNEDSNVVADTKAAAGDGKDEDVKAGSENVKKSSENVKVDSENVNANANSENAEAENVNKTSEKENPVKQNQAKQTDKKGSKVGKASSDAKGKPVENPPVDLKLVQGHYKTHAKSTLPHILTEYGLEDKNHPARKKEKQKRKKKRVEVISDAEDDERSRRKARDEQFRNVFASNRETDTYYMEYLDFLEKKVIQQRQKAQKEKEEAEKLRALKEEEESEEDVERPPEAPVAPPPEKQKRRYVRRLERIELKHDDSFLKNLPKTDVARIIALQDKLKREGKLKTQHDVDMFWNDIKKPEVFYQHFKVKKKDTSPLESDSEDDKKPDTQEDTEEPAGPDMPPRSLSHISETSKDRESWAITQKYSTSHGPKTPTSGKKRRDSAQAAREAALDLERRCPKLVMPPLACFSLKLGEKPPDPDEITRKLDLKAREKSRKKFQRKLNKMYQMAMTNTAASNRILAQHGDITNILEGAALRDVIAVFDEPYPTLEDYYRDIADPSRALEVHPDAELRSEGSLSKHSTRQSSGGSRRLTPISDTASRTSSKSRRKKISPEMIEYPKPFPLSFDEVTNREKTMEAKCLSTMWTNYMQAGKSLYTPS